VNMVRRFPLLRGGKLHCLTPTYSNSGRQTTKISIINEFFFRARLSLMGERNIQGKFETQFNRIQSGDAKLHGPGKLYQGATRPNQNLTLIETNKLIGITLRYCADTFIPGTGVLARLDGL
jgi:hypothetical protein